MTPATLPTRARPVTVETCIDLEVSGRYVELHVTIYAFVTARTTADHDADGCGLEPVVEIRAVNVNRTRANAGANANQVCAWAETLPGWLCDLLCDDLRDAVLKGRRT